MKSKLKKTTLFIFKSSKSEPKRSTDPTTTNATHTVTSIISHQML